MRTLHPYPIPEEEGDEGLLIASSAMGDLNRYFWGSSGGIHISGWKLKNDSYQ